jgi:hypothetical protein
MFLNVSDLNFAILVRPFGTDDLMLNESNRVGRWLSERRAMSARPSGMNRDDAFILVLENAAFA